MPRKAAVVTQADVARAIRAAKQEGRSSAEMMLKNGVKLTLERLDGVEVLPVKQVERDEPNWIAAQRRDAMMFPGSQLYFIAAGKRAIKIGISGAPYARLANLQTAHYEELTLLGTMQGHEETEGLLHAEFRKEHLRGEWFRASKRLRQFIEGHASL